MTVSLTAAGKVCTGFSKPYVAKYSCTDSTISYSDGMKLARGVSVELNPETADSNIFHADNVNAENVPGTFTGGTASLGVDGLLIAAERLIMGLPAASNDGWTAYDDDQTIPYVGIGYIARYMCAGVTSYVPTVLVKTAFHQLEMSHETQEEEIDWQTQDLTADIFRGDDAKHTWKYVGDDFATEAEAEAALKTKLNIS